MIWPHDCLMTRIKNKTDELMVSVEAARQWQQNLKRFRFQGLNKILNRYVKCKPPVSGTAHKASD